METARIQSGNTGASSNAMNAGASTNTTNATYSATAGNASFTQTLVQVLKDGSGSDSSTSLSLTGTWMPGLLVGSVGDTQEQSKNPAEALLQLLAQLLNGAQDSKEMAAEDTNPEGNVDVATSLAQLQLLLLQWMSSQATGADKTDSATGNSVPVLQTDKAGHSSAQLLQVLAAIAEQQANPSSTQPPIQTITDLLKPVLAEVAASVTKQASTGLSQAAPQTSAAAQQNQAFLIGGEAFLPTNRKPAKEQQAASTTGAQPLVQIVNEGRSQSGLSWLAAKGVLQAPVIPVVTETSAAAMNAGSDVPVDGGTGIDTKDQTQGQAVFRVPTPTESIVKGDTHVVSANRFAHEMSQLFKSMNIQAAGGRSEIKITLMPEHLGQVDVKLSMHNGQLVAQFVADSLHGKDLLESQLPQLRAVLQSQGLQVDRLEVSQGQGAAFAMFQEQRQQQSSQHFNRKQQGKPADGEEGPIDFDAELAVLAARRAAIAGSSFDVSA